MADTTAFDALIAILPPDHRSCFIQVSGQIRLLPLDDDLAIALEVFGFGALIFKEFPGEITESMDRIRLSESDTPHEEIEAFLVNRLDDSCYKRLRETLRLVKHRHRHTYRQTEWIVQSDTNADRWLARHGGLARMVVFGICAGAASGAILLCVGALSPRTPASSGVESTFEPKIISYHGAEITDLGGKVGMVLVGGEVLAAFVEQDRGVAVIKPISKP